MNRILTGIERANKAIAAKALPADKLTSMSTSLNMDVAEYCRFQQAKSIASCNGKLSLEEAQTVYGFLGNTPEYFNAQPLAVKWVLTEVFASLLKPA